MATVRRANVVLKIVDNQVDRFINMGYDVIDEKGNVIQKSISSDPKILKVELEKANKEIADLKAEIEKLKGKANAVAKEVKDDVVDEEETPVVQKPKTTKRTK